MRLKNYDYSQNGMYFITICTKWRRKILAKISANTVGKDALVVPTRIGNLVKKCWENIQVNNNNIYIHDYIIMPNHIHGIIEIRNKEKNSIINGRKYGFENEERRGRRSLQGIMKDFKSVSTRRYNNLVSIDCKNTLWQKSYYEHVIRNEKDYLRILEYIQNNPLNWVYDQYY